MEKKNWGEPKRGPYFECKSDLSSDFLWENKKDDHVKYSIRIQ